MRAQIGKVRSDSIWAALGSSGPNGARVPTTGRLQEGTILPDRMQPSCAITVSDGIASLPGSGRCNDGSNESIVSPKLSKRATLRGVGKIIATLPVKLNVALKTGQDPQSFSFSRSWTPPKTVLHLAAGNLTLVSVTFLIANDDPSCEDLLIGLPVLHHLQVDTRTLLENRFSSLDSTDCSQV